MSPAWTSALCGKTWTRDGDNEEALLYPEMITTIRPVRHICMLEFGHDGDKHVCGHCGDEDEATEQ